MLTEFRYKINFHNKEYCIDNLKTKSKKKIETKFKSLLNKAA